MLCDECKHNQAVVHLVTVTNGVKVSKHLCQGCASMLSETFLPFSVNDMFAKFAEVPEPKRCTVCGTSLNLFKKNGTLGCAHCYTEFKEELKPIIKRVHGRTVHCGRIPQGFEAAKLPAPEETETQTENQSKLQMLTQLLCEAIAAEEYEKAAELRDAVKALRAKGETL